MFRSRGNLYLLLTAGLVTGYIWLFYVIQFNGAGRHAGLCLVRTVTGMPCPSCGSTRAVISLLHGNLVQSVYINPLGIPVALIMTITPFWILFDILAGKSTLLKFYGRFEEILRKPGFAIPIVILVLINWIWNITKGI